MKVERIVKQKNNQYKVILSDKTSLSFYDDTIIKCNLLSKREFDEKKLEEIVNYNNSVSAYYDALKYIKSKLRTKKEIKDKLRGKNFSDDIIDKTIKRLEEQMYLNDELYIKCYVADQINLTLKGPKKIVYELEKLGFKSSVVEKYLDCDAYFWQERIKKIIEKKIKSNHNYSKKILQNKIKQDLVNLGYSNDIIGNLVEDINYQDDEAIIKREIVKANKKYSKKYQGKELELKIKQYLYNKGFTNLTDISNYL